LSTRRTSIESYAGKILSGHQTVIFICKYYGYPTNTAISAFADLFANTAIQAQKYNT